MERLDFGIPGFAVYYLKNVESDSFKKAREKNTNMTLRLVNRRSVMRKYRKNRKGILPLKGDKYVKRVIKTYYTDGERNMKVMTKFMRKRKLTVGDLELLDMGVYND